MTNNHVAISAHGLGKLYRIGHRSLGDLVRGWASRERTRPREFWALRDVSFEVEPGEIVGVLGPNGAGKSTLLKILARVTAPTTGHAEIRGRAASLLEVGTGFHPELSGRENVYLNGAILGMRRTEIDAKFDEIVRFAGIDAFLDLAVKHYSSGMYVRLAFAVAAHLEPDVLLVDEVLSVGDAAFQKRSLAAMDRSAHEGRTVILVSHNLRTLQELCPRSLWIADGQLKWQGPTEEAIERYMGWTGSDPDRLAVDVTNWPRHAGVPDDSPIRVLRVELPTAERKSYISPDEPLRVRIDFAVDRPSDKLGLEFYVHTTAGVPIFESRSSSPVGRLDPGRYRVECELARHQLAPGEYRIGVGVRDPHRGLDWRPNLFLFRVRDPSRS